MFHVKGINWYHEHNLIILADNLVIKLKKRLKKNIRAAIESQMSRLCLSELSQNSHHFLPEPVQLIDNKR